VNHRIDAHPAPGITVRHFPGHPDRTDVFAGGWRVGTYKTATGVLNAIARTRAEAAEGAARYAEAVSRPCEVGCGAPISAHTTPHGGVYAFGADWHRRNGDAAPALVTA
jgi:hypothetical protein